MKTRIRQVLKAGSMVVLIAIVISLISGGTDATTRTHAIALEDASSARVEIDLGRGELALHGGALGGTLAEGTFRYGGNDWAPTMSYDVDGGVGHLLMSQGEGGGTFGHWPWSDGDSVWDVRLNDDVPMALRVHLGIGTNHLTLDGLDLASLSVDTGIGEAIVDLSGIWESGFSATIKGGIGGLTVVLPRDVGVRLVAENLIGGVERMGLHKDGDAYVNDAYGIASVTIDVAIDHRLGGVQVEIAGDAAGDPTDQHATRRP